jgi:sarcosine oxidase/L-pipecolate oxidase
VLLRKDSKILFVGGGGMLNASTALHLACCGYTNVDVLNVFPIPSGNAAKNDLNKVRPVSVRTTMCVLMQGR